MCCGRFVCLFCFFPPVRIQDVNEAEANFNVARSHSQNFAFVHIAHAQFEHAQGKQMCLLLAEYVRILCAHVLLSISCSLYYFNRQHKESHLHITECF